MPIPRPVHLPLDTFSRECFTCGAEAIKLRLCASCGEAVYCSTECQRQDWEGHKQCCGKNVQLDLSRFFPFLALLKDFGHWMDVEGIDHPLALRCPILGFSPRPVQLPNGSYSRLVVYDQSRSQRRNPDRADPNFIWWPTAPSVSEVSWLFQRIARDGRHTLVPILVGIALGMLREIYTTTSGKSLEYWNGKPQQRIRLKYRSSPIADFGIARGRMAVKPYNRLAYYDVSTKTYSYGQDPYDHYWLYFETGKGRIINLDCGLGAFGLNMSAQTEPYNEWFEPQPCPGPDFEASPMWFTDRKVADLDARLHTTIKRCSILRNEGLRKAAENTRSGDTQGLIEGIQRLLTELRGVECSEEEAKVANRMARNYSILFSKMLDGETWKSWPNKPEVCTISNDPLAQDTKCLIQYFMRWLFIECPPMDLNQFLQTVV